MSSLLIRPEDEPDIIAAIERRPPIEHDGAMFLYFLAGALLIAAAVVALYRPINLPQFSIAKHLTLSSLKPFGIAAAIFVIFWFSLVLVERNILPFAVVKDAWLGAGLALSVWLGMYLRNMIVSLFKR